MIQVIFNEDTSQKGSFCKKEQNLSKNTVQILKSPLCNFSQELPLSHYRMPVLQNFRPFTYLSHYHTYNSKVTPKNISNLSQFFVCGMPRRVEKGISDRHTMIRKTTKTASQMVLNPPFSCKMEQNLSWRHIVQSLKAKAGNKTKACTMTKDRRKVWKSRWARRKEGFSKEQVLPISLPKPWS